MKIEIEDKIEERAKFSIERKVQMHAAREAIIERLLESIRST